MFSRGPKPMRFDTPEKEKRRMDFFPQYSSSHPAFEKEAVDMQDMKPHEMSDGTPRTIAMSPGMNSSFTDLVKSPSDSNKQIPLHVQTDETEDEEDAYIPERPEDFAPYRTPPPAKQYYVSKLGASQQQLNGGAGASAPMFEMPRARDLKLSASWKKLRLCILTILFLGLLFAIILLPMWATGRFGKEDRETTPSSSTGSNFGTMADGIFSSTSAPTLSWFNPAGKGKIPMLPDSMPGTFQPTTIFTAAPVLTSEPKVFEPTSAPSAQTPIAPTIAPTAYPTTMAPTLDKTHRFIPVLSPVVPEETLMDPYSFAGQALIWLVDKDLQLQDVNSDRRIIQRYALAVLDVALHAPKARVWSSRNMHECRWPGVTCDEQRWVTGVNWARQNLEGTIPTELGLLSKLTSVDVAQNRLKGNLEPLYSLGSLEYAYVFENRLTGTLSKDIENCGNLTRLFAGHNQLTGSIPAGLRMRPLQWLILHFNEMTGTIPSDLSLGLNFILDLSHNKFQGTIPENFAEEIVPNIRHLHLDHNQFTGTIPGGFRSLGKGRLRQLFLNDNQFRGAFPDSWNTIKHLNNIDLSKNNFRNNLDEMCLMTVFEYGELVELRADCRICNCARVCRTCRDNIDYKYEYNDDWEFDDDWVDADDDFWLGDDDDAAL